ncbi:DUF4773 domain-containing protein [Caenorhabditis elegans]|uniref:DUF4773 domain-containing protein n=1 Tax=Caenorhabditis elegans TaxID=6239 RepID=O01734_CAEEL|nr:DUF4773 domain-containing protein [Caenorhabditis elegans]CCD63887.1 DUF4773 domain-containing protein [Caenorhabditis elegans]|eukprot:NP_491611.1 Uncharacterized protein CELE_C09D4.2 [Caenorhabditis elegans]
MHLFLSVFLLLILPLISTSAVENNQNIVDFSVKDFNKNINSIDILNKKWDIVSKYVKFNGNSSKLNGRLRLSEKIDKIIFKLGDDGANQNEIIVSLGNRNTTHMTVHTDSYKMKVSTSKQVVRKELSLRTGSSNENGCACVHGNCACCLEISVPEFRHSVCVNATYNPVSIGLDLSIGVDGHYFSEEISLRNPPPVCFSLPIPGAEHIAGVCVAFTKLDLDKKEKILSGCMDFEVELIHLRVLTFKLGCFRMPI